MVEVVVTGLGAVSPIGIGIDAVRSALAAGRSGVRRLPRFAAPGFPVPFGAEVADFDGRQHVRPRKSLKVMSREIQMAFAAADQAFAAAGHAPHSLDPERLGVVFGSDLIQPDPTETAAAFAGCIADGGFEFDRWGTAAMREIQPLWMLKHLPNMPACHIGIAIDARGPNNTITLGDVSSLSALAEAKSMIERGAVDAVLAGGTGSRLMPTTMARNAAGEASVRGDDPEAAPRPFEASRDGEVFGEGAAALLLESAAAARRRQVPALAVLAGLGASFGRDDAVVSDGAIRRALLHCLERSGLSAVDVGLVIAQGRSTQGADMAEARAIRDVCGDVPVTAPSSYYGSLGSGSGAMASVLAILALADGQIPPTRNYGRPDPRCPLNIISEPGRPLEKPAVVVVSHSTTGQAAAAAFVRG
jgi:3-oxoacyl-[acyl-carrier-protein] synthase II